MPLRPSAPLLPRNQIAESRNRTHNALPKPNRSHRHSLGACPRTTYSRSTVDLPASVSLARVGLRSNPDAEGLDGRDCCVTIKKTAVFLWPAASSSCPAGLSNIESRLLSCPARREAESLPSRRRLGCHSAGRLAANAAAALLHPHQRTEELPL
jgi:hypothetical protein